MVSTVIKNWDNKTWLSSKNYILNFNNFLTKANKLDSNSQILDIGCGRGKIIGSLSSKLKLRVKPIGIDLVYHKEKFELNKRVLEEIRKKEFNNDKFNEYTAENLEKASINSINDDSAFEANSVNILYSLPINSFTLVSDKDNEIYLVKIVNSKNNPYNENDENYLEFVQKQNTENRKSILGSYDQLLNDKYKVQLNQKTIDRVKNYFK